MFSPYVVISARSFLHNAVDTPSLCEYYDLYDLDAWLLRSSKLGLSECFRFPSTQYSIEASRHDPSEAVSESRKYPKEAFQWKTGSLTKMIVWPFSHWQPDWQPMDHFSSKLDQNFWRRGKCIIRFEGQRWSSALFSLERFWTWSYQNIFNLIYWALEIFF